MTKLQDDLRMFARFPAAIRPLARQPLTLAGARDAIRQRMDQREERFLALAQRSIYGHPSSPYLALLQLAGCEYGDLRDRVRQRGLEPTLRELRRQGVYVDYEEFKGRRPIVRFGQEIQVSASDFRNPAAPGDYDTQTGGSTGAATSVPVNVEYMMARAPYLLVTLDAHGLMGAPSASWGGILPHSGIGSVMRQAYVGQAIEKWFSPVGWRDSNQWIKYGAATCYLVFWLRFRGMPVPFPQVVRVDQALTVARWVASAVRTHGRCVLHCQLSRAIRVCIAAEEAGLDLRGAAFKGAGEAPTSAKLAHLERAGVHYVSQYGMTEAGSVGGGCARPLEGSDVHLFKDAYVLFPHPIEVPGAGTTVPAFNLTTLHPTAPKVMLNTQVDDYGVVEERNCGCELESYGYTTHLRQIRSYGKLTGEGVSLVGSEMVRILEEVLPARFGGTSQDYQLLEEEDQQGFTRLFLMVHPRLGSLDEPQMVGVVLEALRQSSPMADTARGVWARAETLQVRRAAPIWTQRGKLMPLHMERRTEQPS